MKSRYQSMFNQMVSVVLEKIYNMPDNPSFPLDDKSLEDDFTDIGKVYIALILLENPKDFERLKFYKN